jgi:hypothetical protein
MNDVEICLDILTIYKKSSLFSTDTIPGYFMVIGWGMLLEITRKQFDGNMEELVRPPGYGQRVRVGWAECHVCLSTDRPSLNNAVAAISRRDRRLYRSINSPPLPLPWSTSTTDYSHIQKPRSNPDYLFTPTHYTPRHLVSILLTYTQCLPADIIVVSNWGFKPERISLNYLIHQSSTNFTSANNIKFIFLWRNSNCHPSVNMKYSEWKRDQ